MEQCGASACGACSVTNSMSFGTVCCCVIPLGVCGCCIAVCLSL
jgi:hypothetical protein